MSRIQNKERILKAAREKHQVTKPIELPQISQQKFYSNRNSRGHGMYFKS
jgi:hypothetical protein